MIRPPAPLLSLSVIGLVILAARPAWAQGVPGGVTTERLVVDRPAGEEWPGGAAGDLARGARLALAGGERIAVWVEGEVRATDPDAGPVPVGEAAPGEVVARFGEGRWFAWPREPVVWTAPGPGELVFALNGTPSHRLEGDAGLTVARLGGPDDPPPDGFPAPTVTAERTADGIEVRYRDRAGFGLDVKTLRFVVATSRGTVYRLASWVPPGPAATALPMPPPDLPLPPGIHTMSVTVTDRIGNDALPAKLVFDAAP